MNLPVSVQTAGVGQLLSTNLAGNCRLPVRSNLTGSEEEIWSGGFLRSPPFRLLLFYV